MPYAKPPLSPEAAVYDIPPLKLRPKHRRTRSATPPFSDERGPGAFVSLPNLPRRKSHNGERKAVFHFDDQDSDSSDDAPSSDMNALRLTVDTTNLPSNAPSTPPAQSEQTSSLPFPRRGSPIPSPQPPSPTTLSTASSLPRTPSTPIILSNGKPLKPSLKSSQSSPYVSALRMHSRAQSEPATPSDGPPKNVHFAGEEALRHVRVFKSTGKPVNVSRSGSGAEETETETEYDSSNPAQERNAFPFPSTGPSAAEELGFEIDHTASSSIPAAHPPTYANVHVETLVLPRSRPPVLRGSILVRNIAFSKEVAVRFTLDDWQTTSEVVCKHVVSLPSLPPPFPTPNTFGDHAASSALSNTWDRFSFVIRLEDLERKLHEKTMWLVVRYTATGIGEWWDNNEGKNYRVCFKPAGGGARGKEHSTPVNDSARLSPVMGNSQQRTFSAPSTLKGTPTTEAVQATAHGTQVPSARFALPSPRTHRPSMPARPSQPLRHHSTPQPALSSMGGRSAAATLYTSLPTKLNLLNYAAPSRSPPSSPRTQTQSLGQSDAASQPTESHANTDTGASSSPAPHMHIVGGMPATAPQYSFAWSPSNNSSTQSLADITPPPSYTALPAASESEKQRAKEIVSSPTSSLARDSSYAAFVKQWCFVQSPPSPNIQPPPPPSTGNSAGSAARQGPWPGMRVEGLGGLYGTGIRGDSPMLASM
ncbi:putative phosphatase regulatory subunit-domain-containing protein [Phellopilus nigrolimitatus]|nr:putative phosphatase regulatory subunit-domain-containing protein [Phellopilus nigrolimitatus]